MILFGETSDTSAGDPVVAPAFSDISHAALFIVAVLLTLLAPNLLQRWMPIDLSQVYNGIPLTYWKYRFIGEEIAKTGDIDIVFIGDSGAWNAFDAPLVKESLSRHLGREAVVVNLSANWRGDDRNQQVLTDLLSRRQVRLVVASEPKDNQWIPHPLAKFWWRGGGGDPSAFGPAVAAQYELAQVVGFPRQLWSRLTDPIPRKKSGNVNKLNRGRETFGHNKVDLGWLSATAPKGSARLPLEKTSYSAPTFNLASMKFNGVNDEHFKLSKTPFGVISSVNLLATSRIVKRHGGHFATVVLLALDAIESDGRLVVAPLMNREARPWPLLGVSLGRLFPGFTPEQMQSYFRNETHFNSEGARVFTSAIMPAILELYDNAIAKTD